MRNINIENAWTPFDKDIMKQQLIWIEMTD